MINIEKTIDDITKLFYGGPTNIIHIPDCIRTMCKFKELKYARFIKCVYGHDDSIYMVYDNRENELVELALEDGDIPNKIYYTKLIADCKDTNIYIIDSRVFNEITTSEITEENVHLLYKIIFDIVFAIMSNDMNMSTLSFINLLKLNMIVYISTLAFMKVAYARADSTYIKEVEQYLSSGIIEAAGISFGDDIHMDILEEDANKIVEVCNSSYNSPIKYRDFIYAMNNSLIDNIYSLCSIDEELSETEDTEQEESSTEEEG